MEAHDADKDGKISLEEATDEDTPEEREAATRAFRGADTNGDNYITADDHDQFHHGTDRNRYHSIAGRCASVDIARLVANNRRIYSRARSERQSFTRIHAGLSDGDRFTAHHTDPFSHKPTIRIHYARTYSRYLRNFNGQHCHVGSGIRTSSEWL